MHTTYCSDVWVVKRILDRLLHVLEYLLHNLQKGLHLILQHLSKRSVQINNDLYAHDGIVLVLYA